jgi:hypothetical protein
MESPEECKDLIKLIKVTRSGIEPRTFWTYTKCSNQLSYPAIPWRTSFSMIPQTIRGEQPCAQISISDFPCRPYVNLVTLSKMGNFTLVVQVTPMSYCSHKKWAQKSTDLHRLNVSTTQRRQNQSTCFFL